MRRSMSSIMAGLLLEGPAMYDFGRVSTSRMVALGESYKDTRPRSFVGAYPTGAA
jgi:hypothetical protein